MLFDLRSSGRRRTIKVIYASLALLMGGGLVFFGIGSDVQGGLFDAFKEDSQSGGDEIFEKRVESAARKARAEPQNAAAWAALARARMNLASINKNFDENQRVYTEEGKQVLRQASTDWERHLTLAKENPDDTVASLMIQAYIGLNQLDKAVRAQEVIVEEREPSPALYVQLARLAYTAGQQRKGDLAGKKALELAPKDDRETIQGEIDAAKAAAGEQAAQQQAGG